MTPLGLIAGALVFCGGMLWLAAVVYGDDKNPNP